jgi:hypothetical protein
MDADIILTTTFLVVTLYSVTLVFSNNTLKMEMARCSFGSSQDLVAGFDFDSYTHFWRLEDQWRDLDHI